MSTPFVAGGRVIHRILGLATVKSVLEGGRKLLIVFDQRPGTPYLYPSNDFQVTNVAASTRGVKSAPPAPVIRPRQAPGFTTVDRQSLEALRLGVVPVKGLDRLTVGREEERERLGTLLGEGRGMLVISGGYGTGKTHLLELAEADALRNNFLVARATFDPLEVPPSHPLRLYRALIEGLRYPGGTGSGLRPLLEKLADLDEHTSPKGAFFHRWLSPVAWALRHADDEALVETAVDWVEGRAAINSGDLSDRLIRHGWTGPRLLALPDYRTFGQMMANLLGGIAVWAKAAGYRGIATLLDEAEFLDTLGSTAREMAENVLRYLAVGTLPRASLAFNPDQLYRGGHSVHRAVEPIYRPDQPLLVLCAFTPHPVIDAALSRVATAQSIRMDIDPVPERLLPLLSERVLAMVQEVYPDVLPPEQHRNALRRALKAGFDDGSIANSRQAARLCVEYWDLYRTDPQSAARALRA